MSRTGLEKASGSAKLFLLKLNTDIITLPGLTSRAVYEVSNANN
jgi:hypothetical protein